MRVGTRTSRGYTGKLTFTTQKAYCDKENAESEAKKADNIAEIEKLTTKIDQASARSAKLKEEVTFWHFAILVFLTIWYFYSFNYSF